MMRKYFTKIFCFSCAQFSVAPRRLHIDFACGVC